MLVRLDIQSVPMSRSAPDNEPSMSHQPREIFVDDGKLTWIHLFRIEQPEVCVAKPPPPRTYSN
jgi:hypothetical protein